MKHLRNENGWIKPLLTIAILGLAVYSGLEFGMPYYRQSALKSEAKEIARSSQGDLKKVKEDVLSSATTLKVPVGENDIVVEKRDSKIHIQASWSQTVDILGLYQKTLDFSVDVTE